MRFKLASAYRAVNALRVRPRTPGEARSPAGHRPAQVLGQVGRADRVTTCEAAEAARTARGAAARGEEVLEEGDAQAGDAVGVVVVGLEERGAAHRTAAVVVVDEAEKGGGHRVGVARGDEEAVRAVGDDLAGAERAVGADDGK